jgi:predicted transcriptional regulator
MRTVSFKLPEDLDDALSKLALRRGASRSALVREAIAAFAADKTRSVTSAVDAISRPIDGPRDLSTNTKHMAGFGK